MEAVRAVTESSCIIEVVVDEASAVNREELSSWRDYTVRTQGFKNFFGVARLAYSKTADNLDKAFFLN